MNRKLIAAPLVVMLFLLATPATSVLADGGFFTEEMFYDLYESAQRAVILWE